MANAFDQFDTEPAQPAAAPPTPAPNPFDAIEPRASSNPFDRFDAGTIQRSAAATEQPEASGGVFAAVGRGKNNLDIGLNAVRYMLGASDPDSFAREVARNSQEAAQYPMSERELEALQRFQEAEGPIEWVQATDPGLLANWVAENVLQLGAGAVGAVAGTVAGGFAGGPAGAGAGAFVGAGAPGWVTEYGTSFMSYLQSQGIDPRNEVSMRAALADKDLINEAHHHAAVRTGVVAVFDVVSAKLGGKVAAKYFAPDTSIGQKIIGAGAELGVSGGGEAAGEAGAQLATTGTIDPKEVYIEGLVGSLVDLPVTVGPTIASRAQAGASQTAATEADVAATAEAVGESAPLPPTRKRADVVGTLDSLRAESQGAREVLDAVWQQVEALPPDATQEQVDAIVGEAGVTPTASELAPREAALSQVLEQQAALSEGAERAEQSWQKLKPAADLSVRAMQDLAKQLGISKPVRVVLRNLHPESSTALGHIADEPGQYRIDLSLGNHRNAEEVYATLMHEFGHVTAFDKWGKTSREMQEQLNAAYQDFVRSVDLGEPVAAVIRRRDNAISNYYKQKGSQRQPVHELSREQLEYWTGFTEWMAEQGARWATTDLRPLNAVDRFFSSLGKRLRKVVSVFAKRTKLNVEPAQAYRDWVESFVVEGAPTLAQLHAAEQERSRRSNEADLAAIGVEGERGTPRTAETVGGRNIGDALFAGNPPPEFRGAAAAADSYNWLFKWGLGVLQLADRPGNRNIRSLQLYKELVEAANNERFRIMNGPQELTKKWQRLGATMARKLDAFIDDYANMRFLSPEEKRNGVERKPTQDELRGMIRRHGLSSEALTVFQQAVRDYRSFLTDNVAAYLRSETEKISDPVRQAEAVQAMEKGIQDMVDKPYFTFQRYGQYTIAAYDTEGRVVGYWQFESKRERRQARRKIEQTYGLFELREGVIEEQHSPLVAMPPALLEAIAEKLGDQLTPAMKETIQELRFQMSPAQSFKHRLQNKKRVAGYSMDFMRAYSNYFFHGANFLVRVKYADRLRGQIKSLRQQARAMPDGTKRGKIANFLDDHLTEFLNPKPDFTRLRAGIFHWALGFSPAAAALNLTQIPTMSLPYLSDKFGEIRAMNALLRNAASIENFYRQATLKGADATQPKLRAMGEAIVDGTLTESQAAQLAGVAEGRNFGRKFGSQSETLITTFGEWSAALFRFAEAFNRRVTFGAAWDLALRDVNAPHVREVVRLHQLNYNKLLTEGWSHPEAAAYVTAKYAVGNSQYTYSGYARPRFMRGKLGTVFVFKMFMQSTLATMINHPGTAVRSIIVMAFLGGLMGIPGMEDISDILRVVAWRIFGKDFDLEREARKLVTDLVSDPRLPELALHGISRESFGLPMLLETMGVHPQVPRIDMSRSVGLGAVNPVPLSPLLGPTADSERGISESAQRAAGAAYGLGFNFYKAATNTQLSPSDWKRWERAMPRAMVGLSKSWRAFNEGVERTSSGAVIARYDINDTAQMMEALALAAGFQPTRVTSQWDRVAALRDAVMFWDLRRQGLLRQLDWARQRGDVEGFRSVLQAVKKFNTMLPKEAKLKKITREQMKQSLEQRQTRRKLFEAGVEQTRANRLIANEINRLYPEVEVDRRSVK